jgi:mRNA interferase RelE/StbE
VYEVYLEGRAERDLKRLATAVRARIVAAIRTLAADPRPHGARKLRGTANDWRIRVGDYRVIYEIVDWARHVRVMIVRHRSEAYR